LLLKVLNDTLVSFQGGCSKSVPFGTSSAEFLSRDRQLNVDSPYFENGKLKIDDPTYTEQKINFILEED
jgi:hypothetical protein